jgi:2-iminobutanoate/2-iminopropanoate deaminase
MTRATRERELLMSRQIFNTDSAAPPVGPYSHSVRVSGELLFISGQIPIDTNGEIVGSTAPEQARQCLKNLATIAEAAGTSLDQAVKLTVLLTDITAFAEVNSAYAEFFQSDPPARVAYEVAALPRGAQVEIDAIIAVG